MVYISGVRVEMEDAAETGQENKGRSCWSVEAQTVRKPTYVPGSRECKWTALKMCGG